MNTSNRESKFYNIDIDELFKRKTFNKKQNNLES